MQQSSGFGTAPNAADPNSERREATDQARRDAGQAGRSATDLGNDLKREGEGLVDEARAQASDLAGKAQAKAREFAEQGKEAGAEQIGGVARAIRGAADELDESAPGVARYARDAASGVERVSKALRERSVDDMLHLSEDFARRQPVAFFGTALVAGFALSRFLKSSSDRRVERLRAEGGAYQSSERPSSAGYGSGGYGSGGYGSGGYGSGGYGGQAASEPMPATPGMPRSTTGTAMPDTARGPGGRTTTGTSEVETPAPLDPSPSVKKTEPVTGTSSPSDRSSTS